MRLNKLLLPTLGRPTIDITGSGARTNPGGDGSGGGGISGGGIEKLASIEQKYFNSGGKSKYKDFTHIRPVIIYFALSIVSGFGLYRFGR
jgi:hypothetical protein